MDNNYEDKVLVGAAADFEVVMNANNDDVMLLLKQVNETFATIGTIACADVNNTSSDSNAAVLSSQVQQMVHMIEEGQYVRVMDLIMERLIIMSSSSSKQEEEKEQINSSSIIDGWRSAILKDLVCDHPSSSSSSQILVEKYNRVLEWLCLAIAGLNIFLQLNYTGPAMQDEGKSELDNVIRRQLQFILGSEIANDQERRNRLIMSQLSVDGEWPTPIVECPYVLLLARVVLHTLTTPDRHDWQSSTTRGENDGLLQEKGTELLRTLAVNSESVSSRQIEDSFLSTAGEKVHALSIWSARAVVAHQRLMNTRTNEPCPTLWEECKFLFSMATKFYVSGKEGDLAARITLEWGLAEHHFEAKGKGKKSFYKALNLSELNVDVTGAEGKRTKYQQEAKAQLLVRATTNTGRQVVSENDEKKEENKSNLPDRVVHSEEGILLERVKYENEENNEFEELNEFHQAILLSLCLDVKNDNPMDGLTAEQMGAYLERTLLQHDDWMIYATGLLERAWLDFERSHSMERAILQMQALVDQHSDRLTITQSTYKAAVEDSAPPQKRLRNLHTIVYPPRWYVKANLAEKYARLGVVTSAAELFTEVEMWDDVVECYRRAGKGGKAEEVIRERLEVCETPRMLAALGDVTDDPSYYEKAWELSNGRYASAYFALGRYQFNAGDVEKAHETLSKALIAKPLEAGIWFLLGTISMRLSKWSEALHAFSQVVLLEPEEGEAWANVAAVHMHNRNPAKAYPALNEAIKQNRKSWRMWVSKLYTCIDLEKYDEAIQACNQLLSFKSRQRDGEDAYELEEKCVRAIVGGSLTKWENAVKSKDTVFEESSKRTLERVEELLNKMQSTTKAQPWLLETISYFNNAMGNEEVVLDNLMKEYRTLQTIDGWETQVNAVEKLVCVVKQICDIHLKEGSKSSLNQGKFLLRNVTKKIKSAYFDENLLPESIKELEILTGNVEDKLHH